MGVQAKYACRNKYIQQAYLRSPRKSTCQAGHKLNIPQISMRKIPHKYLAVWHYQLQTLQNPIPNNRETHPEFCMNMVDRIAEDKTPYQKSVSAKSNRKGQKA
jgi:hypothetical protein